MLKMTPESKIKQKELYEAHVAATKESKKAAKSGKANANSAAAKLKSSNNSRASTPVSDKSEPKDTRVAVELNVQSTEIFVKNKAS